MDEAKVIHACRLLRKTLRADLELHRMVLRVEHDRVVLTVFRKTGNGKTLVVVDDVLTVDDLSTENVSQLDDWR
jgi:hypothetical protein